jgi:hypothetical protein
MYKKLLAGMLKSGKLFLNNFSIICAKIFFRFYRYLYSLENHTSQIVEIFVVITIKIIGIDAEEIAKYVARALRYELLYYRSHFINLEKKYGKDKISIMVLVSFKSLEGYKVEEFNLLSLNYDSESPLNYNEFQRILVRELTECLERYSVEYFESILVKIL